MTLIYRHDLTREHLAAGAREFLDGLQAAEDCHVLLYRVVTNHISPTRGAHCNESHTIEFDDDVNSFVERFLQELAIDDGLHAVLTQVFVRIASTLHRAESQHLTAAERRDSLNCASDSNGIPYEICTQRRMHMAICAACGIRPAVDQAATSERMP
jgi:hypothetical protein